ncbi:MAG: shikimate dehydrogenase [Desulfobacterales bacterium]|jgi:shikimate dehydrogenase
MKVFCILSDERVYGSKSPAMFSRVLQRIGMQGVYVPFKIDPQNVGKALQSLRILNIAGANVTVPYKEKVIPYLDELSEGANIIGAINTIVCSGDTLKGYNTNAIGFMDALIDAKFETAGKSALVFGTGGAAKAVVFMLNWLRAGTIRVAGRNPAKTAAVANRFDGQACSIDELLEQPVAADIVVNATSVSSPKEAPQLAALVEKLRVPGCQLIIDLNYGRSQNFWQDLARRNDIRFMDGLPALAYQARRTLALWTKVQVAPEEFLNALQEA